MANEIKIQTSLTLTNGLLKFSFAPGTLQIAQTLAILSDQVVVVATTPGESLVIPADITTYGIAIFYNLDATNYVSVGIEVAAAISPSIRLLPGDPPAILPSEPGVTWWAMADTAAVNLQVIMLGR